MSITYSSVNIRNLKTIAFMAGILVVLFGIYFGCSFLFPLFLSFGLAYATSPVVDFLEKRGVSRTITVSALLALIVGALLLALLTLVPLLVEQAEGFIGQAPELLSKAGDRLSNFTSAHGINLPIDLRHPFDRAAHAAQGVSSQQIKSVGEYAARVFSGIGAVAETVLGFVIIPVFYFFFLRDLPRIKKYLFSLVPHGYRDLAKDKFHRSDSVLAGYIRGQLIVALILSAVYGVGLLLIGVRFGLIIGIAAGLLSVIPYLGHLSGFTVAMILALIDFQGWGHVLAIPALFVGAHLIEGTFITPRIVGDKVGIAPVWAMIALIVGGHAAGLMGMLMAIPVAGLVKIMLHDLVLEYKKSSVYSESAAAKAAPASEAVPVRVRE